MELIPTGHDDVTQLEIRVGVTQPELFADFYTKALGATPLSDNRFKIGDTIIAVFHEPETTKKPILPFANALEVVKGMAGLGIRYITLGVKDCEAAFTALKAAGAAEALAPVNFGTVAESRSCAIPMATLSSWRSVPPRLLEASAHSRINRR